MPQTLSATPIISVIIATRNRRESLRQFIEALRSLPNEPAWELVVADNGSTDGTDLLLAKLATDFPLVVVRESRPGKSRALNRAMEQARGELLVFSDDDVVPEKNWLAALHDAATRYPAANIFGGRICVDYERIPEWIVHSSNLRTMLVSEQNLGNDLCWFDTGQYPIGPNLAVRRRALGHIFSAWPVNLGPGTRIPLGDERIFLMQISPPYARDRLYVPKSIVQHQVRGRQLRACDALARCFLGGFAAGISGRMDARRDMKSMAAGSRALARLRAVTSSQEMFCIFARALGVMFGSICPRRRGAGN